MPYKLWIVPKITPPRKYRKFLSFFELVAGVTNTIELEIKNIGKKTFPGGELPHRYIDFERAIGWSTLTSSPVVNPEIPPIEPNEVFVKKFEWIPRSPGVWWITMEIKLGNKEKIEYYQSRKGSPLENGKWLQILNAVDRRQLDLNLLLEKTLSKRR